MTSTSTKLAMLFAAIALTIASPPAAAVDGCKVLLCFAGNWKDISQCRPEVEQALKDQAKGKGWPKCNETQASSQTASSNSTVQKTLSGPACPYQFRTWDFQVNQAYTESHDKLYGVWKMTCKYTYALDTTIDGKPWKRTYVDVNGNAIDEWYQAGRDAFPVDVGSKRIGADLVYDEWVSSGSPTTKPPLPNPDGMSDMSPGAYLSCRPSATYSQICQYYDDGLYIPK